MQNDVQRVERAVQTICSSSNNKMDNESPSTSRSNSIQRGASIAPGLHCLVDGEPNERPPYSNFTLVKYAILGSPNQKLTLSEIYLAIASRFPWFQTAGKGWKNSVRHCLSLDTQFQKQPRPPTQPGKGCYWTVSLDTPRGNKRERKRNKKPSRREMAAELVRLRADPPSAFPLITPAFRDYATTLPVKSTTTRSVVQPPAQSGWTPYFPTAAMMSAPIPLALRGQYTEVPRQAEATAPGTLPSEAFLKPSASQQSEDESDEESEADLSE